MRSIAQSAVKDIVESAETKKLIHSLHGMQVEVDLKTFENDGLRYALDVRKTQKTKGNNLNLQQRKEYRSSAVIWSPRKFRESRVREAVRLQEEEKEKLQKKKKNRKEMKATATLYTKQQAKERKEAREKAQEERKKEKEKKAQEVA
jgi:hypothetical protein